MLSGSHRHAGEGNRCYTCDGEYHLAPWRPQRRQWKPAIAANPPSVNKAPRSPFPPIFKENPVSVCMDACRSPKDGSGNCEPSSPTTSEPGSQLFFAKDDSAVILGYRSSSQSCMFSVFEPSLSSAGEMGLPRVTANPAQARFEFGDGRLGSAGMA